MKKKIVLLVALMLCFLFSACGNEDNTTNTTDKKYQVEIDGQKYYADTQEEIDKIINNHVYDDIDEILDFDSSVEYIDADKIGKTMISIESGEYLGVTSGGYTEFYFKVRNVSDVPIHTVTISIDVLDEYGDIVYTTHPQESSTLKPGQAINIDGRVENDRDGVAAIVSSYSLMTMDGAYVEGRINNSAKVEFVDSLVVETEKTTVSSKVPEKPDKECVECGESATYTYGNPFSKQPENYCYTHYREILNMISDMEDDDGGSSQSKHTCEQCNKEGTNKYESFTGQTEYYCADHYKELIDMLNSFGLD